MSKVSINKWVKLSFGDYDKWNNLVEILETIEEIKFMVGASKDGWTITIVKGFELIDEWVA